MAKVDDFLQSGTKQIVLAVVAWLAHGCPPDSESRRRRNHEPPKSGIPKRKKTATHKRLSCKNRILAQVKSRRWFNRFRILHGRLVKFALSPRAAMKGPSSALSAL
jgi:hypothetical protein